MNGPYGYDLAFAVTIGTCFFLFLCVACVIECYLEARHKRR
jgi:hypothetical protein